MDARGSGSADIVDHHRPDRRKRGANGWVPILTGGRYPYSWRIKHGKLSRIVASEQRFQAAFGLCYIVSVGTIANICRPQACRLLALPLLARNFQAS